MRGLAGAILLVLALMGTAHAQVFGELRGGVFASGVDDGQGDLFSPTRLKDANLEFVFNPLVQADVLGSLNPAVGVTANFGGGESYGYAGLNWHVPITLTPIFVEAGVGAALSSNVLGQPTPSVLHIGAGTAQAHDLGCAVLVRAQGSVGLDITPLADVMLTAEHYFPANSCGTEQSTTNVGVRVGFRF